MGQVFKNHTAQAEDRQRIASLVDLLMSEWRGVLERAFEDRLEGQMSHRAALVAGNMTTYPFLKILPVGDYVDVMLKELERLLRYGR